MALFSITCETCQTRLKVRNLAAIGQILNCPTCQAMLEVKPPEGWDQEAAVAAQAQADAEKQAAADQKAAAEQAAQEQRAAAAAAAALAPAEREATANPTAVAQLEEQASSAWLPRLLPFAAVAVILILGAGMYWLASPASPPPPPEEPVVAAADAAKPASDPQPATKAANGAAAEDSAESDTATTAGGSDQPGGEVSPEDGPGEQDPQAEPLPESVVPGTNMPRPDEQPGEEEPPVAEPVPGGQGGDGFNPDENPPPVVMPDPVPPAPGAAEPPAVVAEGGDPEPGVEAEAGPRKEIEIAARLRDPIAKLVITEKPLASVVDFLAKLSTVPMSFDLAGLADVGVTPNDPVSVRVADSSIEETLEATLQPLGLAVLVEEDHLLITSAQRQQGAIREQLYPVADLLAKTTPEKAGELTGLVRQLVRPGSWDQPGVSLVLEAGRLRVRQSVTAHTELTELLAKLRQARGLDDADELAAQFPLASRWGRLSETLAAVDPVTANFEKTALERIIKYLESRSGLTILLDTPGLLSLGLAPESRVTIRGKQAQPLEEVLRDLLEPLGLGSRAVDGQTLAITTRATIDEGRELELYRVSDLVPVRFSGEELIAQLRQAVEPESWSAPSTAVIFDADSGSLIIRQSQPVQRQVEQWLTTFRLPPPEAEPKP